MLGRKLRTFLIDWQWVILVFISPLLLFPSAKRSIVLILFPLLWLSTLLWKRKDTITPLNLPILILLVMLLVSTWATYDIGVSFPNIAGLFLGLGFYFAFRQAVIGTRGLQFPFLAFSAACLGVALLSLFTMQRVEKIEFINPLLQIIPSGFISLPGEEAGFHPNIVAGALLWFLPLIGVLFISLLIKRRGYVQKIGAWRYALLTLVGLLMLLFISLVFLLTQSRSAYLALFLTLMLTSVLLFPQKIRWMAGGFLVCILLVLTWYSWQQGWIQTLYAATGAGGISTSVVTLNGRVEIWSRALYGIQDFPFTGMGMNTFQNIVRILYPLFTISPDYNIGHAHNEFLQVALDLGIPGLIAFISIYFIGFSMLIQTYRRSGFRSLSRHARGLDRILLSANGIKALALGFGLSLLAHALFGITDAIALGTKPGILFWMLLGLTAGLHHLVCTKPPAPSKLNSQNSPLNAQNSKLVP
jgi:putative inorganic carbon (HCO3(-)) transporter